MKRDEIDPNHAAIQLSPAGNVVIFDLMPPRGNLFQQRVYVGHLDERKRKLKATWPNLLICQRYSLLEIGAAKGVKGCLSPLDIAI